MYFKPKFPIHKSDILKKWLDNMGIKNWIPNNSSLLCSEHFEETCFQKRGQKLFLKERSVRLRLIVITIDFVSNKSINDIDNYMLLKKKLLKFREKVTEMIRYFFITVMVTIRITVTSYFFSTCNGVTSYFFKK